LKLFIIQLFDTGSEKYERLKLQDKWERKKEMQYIFVIYLQPKKIKK